MEEAGEVLHRALELDPDLASAHFFLGLARKTFGEYDEALRHLRAAAARYPRDRVVRNQIGRVLFLQREYDAAVVELQKVLAVDPEDLQAHYTLMLASRGAGDAERAKTHEALYRRFKADESSQAITGPYRQLHPYDNNERQAVHEHRQGPRPEPAERYSKNPGQAVHDSSPRSAGAHSAGSGARGSR